MNGSLGTIPTTCGAILCRLFLHGARSVTEEDEDEENDSCVPVVFIWAERVMRLKGIARASGLV